MINQQLAELSNLAIVVTIVLYVLALIGFGADLASSSQRRSDARLAAQERKEAQEREMSPASVGASGAEAEGATAVGGTAVAVGPDAESAVGAGSGAVSPDQHALPRS